MQYKTGLTSAAILASTAFAACMYIMWFVSYISKIYLFQISETRRTIWLLCSGIEKKKTKFHSFRTFRHRWNSIRYRFNAFVLFTIFIIFLLFQASDHFHACFANWLLFFFLFPFSFFFRSFFPLRFRVWPSAVQKSSPSPTLESRLFSVKKSMKHIIPWYQFY